MEYILGGFLASGQPFWLRPKSSRGVQSTFLFEEAVPLVSCANCRCHFYKMHRFWSHSRLCVNRVVVSCVQCHKGYTGLDGLEDHQFQAHGYDVRSLVTPIEYHLTTEDMLGQRGLGMFYVSPDLTTGERGLCTE